MKRSITFLTFILVTVFAYGQQVVSIPEQNTRHVTLPEKATAYMSKFFGCPECDFISKVSGVCPFHQATLVRFGTYYFPEKYHYISAKRGNCPQHKIALKEMEVKFREPAPAPR